MPEKVQALMSPSSKRSEGFAVIIGTVSPGHASGSYAKCSQIGRKLSDMRHRGLGKLITPSQDPRSHQRRWSADFCKGQTSCVIIARKNKREPEPPQRSLSLVRAPTASRSSLKRYSCPPIGVFHSPSQSSSSSSSTSSCSSPPPVPTSVITGHDPLGWKLHPKSDSASSRSHARRLSLQIPLPVVCPNQKSGPTPTCQSHNTPLPKTKPPLRPKPSRRCYSDSSAILRPLVTLEDLRALDLHPVPHPEESDDVFSDGNEGQGKPCRMSPPVPNKTFMARQIAQLIAHSRRHSKPATIKTEEDLCVAKPRQTADYNSVHATKHGLRLELQQGAARCTLPGQRNVKRTTVVGTPTAHTT